MNRYTIWRHGYIMGTYSGADEHAALNALAIAEGFKDIESCDAAKGLTRDDYKVKKA